MLVEDIGARAISRGSRRASRGRSPSRFASAAARWRWARASAGPCGRPTSTAWTRCCVMPTRPCTRSSARAANIRRRMHATLPDGTKLELPDGASGADLAAAIGPGLARAALAVKVDGEVRDLARPLPDGDEVEIVTNRSPESLELIRHDTAHVLAAAVLDLYPGTKISIGPPIEDGFYYDFEFPDGRHGLRRTTSRRSRRKMREHVKADEPFVREDVAAGEALERFVARGPALQGRADRGPRRERGRRRPSRSTPTAPFTDLCRGPHAPGTGRIKAFKLLSRRRRVLARRRRPPDAHAHLRHRVPLARRTSTRTSSGSSRRARATTASSAASSTCSCSPSSRPGSPFWLPNGMAIWNELDRRCGARRTPRAATARSRRRSSTTSSCGSSSGHWDVYRDNMYFTEVEDRPMGLKPMNCPAHIQLYKRRAALLPRPADPLLRAGPRAPPRAERHAARPAARPPHHPGRRAHLLHRGADRGGGQPLPRLRLRDLRHVRLRAAARALDAAREADRHRGDVGPRRGRAAARARAAAGSSTSSTRATARSTARRSTCT